MQQSRRPIVAEFLALLNWQHLTTSIRAHAQNSNSAGPLGSKILFYFISVDNLQISLISLICIILQACLVCPAGNIQRKANTIFYSKNFLFCQHYMF
jgi:hypothetical protein